VRTPLRKSVAAAAPLLAAALSLGCRSLPFPEPNLEGEYGEVLRTWAREQAVYEGLETRAFAHVIYLAPPLVDAQASMISRMRAEPPPERARTLERMRRETATPTFFAVMHTPDRNWNDLDSKTSIWRVAVDFGGGQFEPEKVERLERPFSAELQKLYPYLDEYAVAYVLRFPAAAAAAAPVVSAASAAGPKTASLPVMIMAGALGTMRFNWTVPGR
jgi:hypothetical protein